MSDYFDRLLARHAPVVRAAAPVVPGTGQPARVRPRLPGPFERVEALRDRPAGDDGLSPAPTPAPEVRPVRTDEGAAPRGVREIHTERHTVVRDALAPSGEYRESEQRQQRPENPSLRPAPRPLRAVAGVQVQRAGQPAGREPGPAASGVRVAGAVPALVAPGGDAAARSAAVRPGSDGFTAGRSARQQAAAARRGGPRASERVVHVQIGRLEVSAATPPGAGRGGAGEAGRQQTGRTAPTVSLETYLAHGRNGERSN
jgi:hypothetical protein